MYVLTILDKDPFGYDYMAYSIRNKCEEIEEPEYGDGLRFYYFYTKGRLGGNEGMKTMLRYIGDSRKENALDEATKKLHMFAESVKIQSEVRESYMLWEDYEEMMREAGEMNARIETVFDFLHGKGEIPQTVTERIKTETNPQILRKWVMLAAKADSVADFAAMI